MQFTGIEVGFCGLKDIEFLHQAGIRWDELVNAILRDEARRREESTAQRDAELDQYRKDAGQTAKELWEKNAKELGSAKFDEAYRRALDREWRRPREG